MTRFILLQGISGTGKTSLGLALAHAVGAGVEVVEVQAGWRDRQDLIGYYNAFHRHYYATYHNYLVELSTEKRIRVGVLGRSCWALHVGALWQSG